MQLDGYREESTSVNMPIWRTILMLTVLAASYAQTTMAQPPAFERDQGPMMPQDGYVDPNSVQWDDRAVDAEEIPGTPPGEFTPMSESASPFADAFDQRQFWYDAFGYYGDCHHEEYYEPGMCSACGGASCEFCGAAWYTEVDFQMLRRNRAKRTTITRGALIVETNPNTGEDVVDFIPGPFFNTDATEFDAEPGMRLTIGRFLGVDDKDRSHSIEGVYYGLQEWETESAKQGETRDTFVTTDANGAVILVEAGQLVSDFPLDLGGFNRADLHAFRYSSNLHTAELNYRIRWQYRPKRLSPDECGAWDKHVDTDWLPNVFVGLRYHLIDEDFAFISRGVIDVNGVPNLISGDWTVKTQNDLIGPQIGGGITRKTRRWEFGLDGKIGLLINSSTLDGRIVVNDPVFPLDRFPPVTNPDNSFSLSSTQLAVAGDVHLNLDYRLTPYTKMKFAYDFVWVGGLALGPEQFGQATILGPLEINNAGTTFFTGPSFGLETVW